MVLRNRRTVGHVFRLEEGRYPLLDGCSDAVVDVHRRSV